METFQRIEKKYLLDQKQYQELKEKLMDHVVPDKYFETSIRSLYYDTDKFELIRRSIEKPEYKEKLRVRSYGKADQDDEVFVELKKKLDGMVYKRRTKARYADLMNNIEKADFKDRQVGNEIRYALNYYGKLRPAVFIGCKRHSYSGKDDESLRVTFDSDISYRMKDLSLNESDKDKKVTDKIVMELKVKDAMPLWLTSLLDEVKAYPRGFSKVGTAFMKEIRGE